MKYLWPIIGHQIQLTRIEEDIANDNLSHAYLFSGPEEIGKIQIAKTLAQILQCTHNYCKSCADCQLIKRENHLDTLFFRNREQIISIEEIRELQQILSRSHNSNYRIVIMEDIERMPIASQNAFLKILEEPPIKTIFLLTTSKNAGIQETILSRCRIFNFYHLDNNLIEEHLRKIITDHPEKVSNILFFSQGKIGLALSLAKDYELYEEKLKLFQLVQSFFVNNEISARFDYIDKIHQIPAVIQDFLETFMFILRQQLLAIVAGGRPQAPLSVLQIIQLIHQVNKSLELIGKNVNRRLVLENLMLNF
jgi:DNA polymerase-3 subunit delta'